MTALDYRPDLDGLRMVAVASVIVHHAAPNLLPGGFVGVDVFFVLSGFLITRLIVAELGAGTFSLVRFYERRARRLLPALLVMLAVTSVAASVMLLPAEFTQFMRSAAAASLFVSNIWFAHTVADYFGHAAEFHPLLHTWSLGVEEQFYLVAPLVFLWVAKVRPNALSTVVAAITVASFILSISVSARWPAFSYYLPFCRAFELGLGALLAIAMANQPLRVPGRSVAVQQFAAPLGLMMIALSAFVLDPTVPFPGAAALVPTLGAVLIIASGAGGRGVVTKALSWRPFVFLGLISYSLYLWHWPVLSFARIGYAEAALPPEVTLMAVAVGFVASVLSWRFVERPFRKGVSSRSAKWKLASVAIVSTALLPVAALAVGAMNGLPGRLSPELAAFVDQKRATVPLRCRGDGNGATHCVDARHPEGAPVDVILLGDSHAVRFAPTLIAEASRQGIAVELIGKLGCQPLLGTRRINGGEEGALCERHNTAVLAELGRRRDAPTVLIHAQWALYGAQRHRGTTHKDPVPLVLTGSAPTAATDNHAVVSASAARTVDAVRATRRRVVLLGTIPEIGWDVPRHLISSLRWGRALPQAPDRAAYSALARGKADAVLAAIADADAGVTYVSAVDSFCRPACAIADAKGAFYIDSHHLSPHGARKLLAETNLIAGLAAP